MGAERSRLHTITDAILDRDSDPSQLLDAVNALHGLCATIVGLRPETDGSDADRETRLDQGRALAPRDAARCILDLARTSAFLRGCHDSVVMLLERFGGRPINVLYSGCGPFAPLALPLTTRFGPDRLRITFVDAHAYSTDSVNRLIEAFDASAWCASVRCGDAMSYVHPASEDLHMVIIETMQKTLEHEPQVALTQKLAPQLVEGGVLVPERIRLSACLADMSAEFSFHDSTSSGHAPSPAPERRRFSLGPILELTADGLRFPVENNGGGRQPETTEVVIPDKVTELSDLMVRTTVDVFGDHRLDDYDSGITYPTLIHTLGRLRPDDRLEFSYEMGPSPGLRVRRMSTP